MLLDQHFKWKGLEWRWMASEAPKCENHQNSSTQLSCQLAHYVILTDIFLTD